MSDTPAGGPESFASAGPSAAAGRRIVLGVGGGIAAYKAVDVCRRLVDAGAHVVPVPTASALRFVGEVTLSALGSEPARTSLWDGDDPIPHTRLGQTADLVLLAPATADLIARYAHGLADDLLTNILLATRAPVMVCPAMHTEMWEHPAVQDNLALLVGRGVHVVPPAEGRLAGGDSGTGRLAEPSDIVSAALRLLSGSGQLAGRRVLVTAGGTREPIDPVRFIGNRSSGKQGHAVAAEARRRGADVVLVTAADQPVAAGVRVLRVETAEQMEAAVAAEAPSADIVVMAAAVADFRPKVAATDKIKKTDGVPEVVLESTPDILAGLAARRRPGQVVVGFAAETSAVVEHAADKLDRKGLDLIVANDVSLPGVGFGYDTNSVVILDRDGNRHDVPLSAKAAVAAAVVDAAAVRLASSAGAPGSETGSQETH
ncbi:MAG TPA: bifunctional phosphopantothenoylcysteine decarboxylase/phosphopantothenate--cysteine ligase CoaBC [Acidimicrobiales bacterium]|nr:bifunctional phosphopantothenoylcysteine decarboxylase/phosphopantothenate--cysteine ligase CoaBC [Acidimicrobiales bacterium]